MADQFEGIMALEVVIITASINELINLKAFKEMPGCAKYDLQVIVVDEGDTKIRKINDEILSNIPHTFYGPREREKWFKQHFGSNYRKYLSIIPERCHSETSFGFLVAYESMPDLVIELDDDAFPFQGREIIGGHAKNLFKNGGVTIASTSRWYNTMNNLILNIDTRVFPRGHPYAPSTRIEKYHCTKSGAVCVLNMGLWTGCPDLDALTILSHGGLNGICDIYGIDCRREKIVVEKGTYFAVCSMNTSFVPKIIPSFYQLYMNYMGIDRFDDIWSGIFLKKIADHLNDRVCLGKPLVFHDKRPRETFTDLRKELEGMRINESLWNFVNELVLDGNDYWDTYRSLIGKSKKYLQALDNADHRKFMSVQTDKMRLWLEVIDKL